MLAPLTPEVVVEEVVAALIDLGFAEASVVDSSCVALKSPGGEAMERTGIYGLW